MWSLKAGFPNLSNEDDICQASSAHLNDGQLTAVSTLSPVSPTKQTFRMDVSL